MFSHLNTSQIRCQFASGWVEVDHHHASVNLAMGMGYGITKKRMSSRIWQLLFKYVVDLVELGITVCLLGTV